jgi:hypothetical protein
MCVLFEYIMLCGLFYSAVTHALQELLRFVDEMLFAKIGADMAMEMKHEQRLQQARDDAGQNEGSVESHGEGSSSRKGIVGGLEIAGFDPLGSSFYDYLRHKYGVDAIGMATAYRYEARTHGMRGRCQCDDHSFFLCVVASSMPLSPSGAKVGRLSYSPLHSAAVSTMGRGGIGCWQRGYSLRLRL